MYHPDVTAAAVAHESQRLGVPLIYHSLSEIDAAIAALSEVYDPETQQLTRRLAEDEIAFIINERTLCALDFRYWMTSYAYIVNWAKQPMRFIPNVAQSIILDLWGESELKGEAIWMQQLKARRLGVSTISELAVTHRFQFQPYTNAVLASADPNKTVEMAGMLKYAIREQPWWLVPDVTKIYRDIPIEFGAQHCTLTIQAGNQFNGVARGSSPNVLHLSELCEWRGAEDLIDAALLPAILDTPNTFGILESTAKGPGWWKRTWEQNKKDWNLGRARLRPVFLPWFVGTDIYPTPTMLRKNPVPPNWIPDERTVAHAERAREYVLTDPMLFKYLAKGDRNWQMPRDQQWWWEVGYQTAKEKKELNIFLAEYCSDDFEAFQSSNIPIIDTEILIGYQQRTRAPLGVYTVIGPDIPPALITPRRYWDPSRPTITVRTRELTPRFDLVYQLVPLQFEGYPSFNEDMKLLIWELPQDQYSYGIGVDCSEGLHQDRSVMEVMREATPMREPGQVAEWASDTVTAFQMWPLVLAVGSLYSTWSSTANRRRQCKLAIEAFTNGSALQNELQKRGWSHFHAWKYNDKRKPQPDDEVARIGVYTNQWFRSSMMDMLLTCLSEEAIDIASPYLISELTTLERAVGTQKVAAAADAYDDRVMAFGFPLFSLHMNKPPHKQYERKRLSYAPGLQADDQVAYPIWTPPAQALSTGPQPVQELTRARRGGSLTLEPYINPDLERGYRR